MKRLFVIGSFLFVLSLAACAAPSNKVPPLPTPVPTVVEPGLAHSEPCKPPCWRGLMPGKTTEQDAAQAVEKLRASGWAYQIDKGPGGYNVNPLPSPYVGTIGINFKNGVVNTIRGQIAFDFSIQRMIERFGEPEWLYAVATSTNQQSCEEWQLPKESTISAPLHILYPKQGLWFMISVPENGLGLICPAMRATGFVYYSPRSISEVLSDKDLANLILPPGIKEQDMTKWHGFGSGY